MNTVHPDFKAQQPHPVPATMPYTPTYRLEARTPPPGDGQGPAANPTIGPKRGQTHAHHHHPPQCKVRIPQHQMTPRDLPVVPLDSKQMSRTCWACDTNAPITPWPVLHLKARHHTSPTTHLPPQAYAWVALPVHRTNTNPTVAWDPDNKPQWLFTTTPSWPRLDRTGIAICYSMYKPGERANRNTPTIHSTAGATRPNT